MTVIVKKVGKKNVITVKSVKIGTPLKNVTSGQINVNTLTGVNTGVKPVVLYSHMTVVVVYSKMATLVGTGSVSTTYDSANNRHKIRSH